MTWFSKLKNYQLSPEIATWMLTIYAVVIGFFLGFFLCHRGCL